MKEQQRYGCGRFKKKPRKWTDEEDQFVRDNIADMTHAEIGKELNRTEGSVNGYCTRKNIKSPGSGQFRKGHEPMNKGKKQADYMSPEAIERTKATRFKKGDKPANTKYNGAITLRHDSGTGRPYLWIRISENNWQMYHVHLWEQEHGPVPQGHIIVFKDGNSMKCELPNLECITRAEHARRNRNWKKAMATMQAQGNHPSKDLTDAYVAAMMAGGNDNLKHYIMDHRPELLKAARAQYKLNRKIREVEDEK